MGDEDCRNPISNVFRAIVGFLITPFALIVLGGSNFLHQITGWDEGYCYPIVFLSPIVVVILVLIGKALHGLVRGTK